MRIFNSRKFLYASLSVALIFSIALIAIGCSSTKEETTETTVYTRASTEGTTTYETVENYDSANYVSTTASETIEETTETTVTDESSSTTETLDVNDENNEYGSDQLVEIVDAAFEGPGEGEETSSTTRPYTLGEPTVVYTAQFNSYEHAVSYLNNLLASYGLSISGGYLTYDFDEYNLSASIDGTGYVVVTQRLFIYE